MPALEHLQPGDSLIIWRYGLNNERDPLRVETVERLTATQAIAETGSRWRLNDGARLKVPNGRTVPPEYALAEKSLEKTETKAHYEKIAAKSAAERAEKERSAACYQLSLRLDKLQRGALWRKLSTKDAQRLTALIDRITQIK